MKMSTQLNLILLTTLTPLKPPSLVNINWQVAVCLVHSNIFLTLIYLIQLFTIRHQLSYSHQTFNNSTTSFFQYISTTTYSTLLRICYGILVCPNCCCPTLHLACQLAVSICIVIVSPSFTSFPPIVAPPTIEWVLVVWDIA